ncbi:DUF2244 domain-containing protein [Azospirillum griseum]|uniref:DUF2244 domain-containing protein n=1 Tax=Azospirillum griseum TaxID=2496639 RepID=A0A3S0K4I4_9PROT|nr:DUF2244 domain-containing protein [Azospirillum griseum]RTR20206.1 DUF2244 domain-containing protein [Azospirillum griseum]
MPGLPPGVSPILADSAPRGLAESPSLAPSQVESAPATDAAPLFDALLTPNDSGTRHGRVIFAAVVAAYAAITLTAWLWLGAWPMAAYGLVVAAFVGWSLLGDAHRRRQSERIQVWPDRTRVEQTDSAGRTAVSDWQTPWLRVTVEPNGSAGPRLTLGSHGRRITVGAFLTVEERQALADVLKRELARASNRLSDAWPVPTPAGLPDAALPLPK